MHIGELMEAASFFRKNGPGLACSLVIAAASWLLVDSVDGMEVIGAPVIAILAGMLVFAAFRGRSVPNTSFTSKYVLQFSVVLLGFGLNLSTVCAIGLSSLPVIVSTISVSLVVAYLMCRRFHTDPKTATLVGVGSSICGGSAIAAAAPVIKADDGTVAQSISVIFLFNIIAAVVFPTLGSLMGMSDDGFALFAGTAINDTSSVTAAASTWDAMHGTGHLVLDSATIVKLTRTLFIIPIVVVLSVLVARRADGGSDGKGHVMRAFPKFVLFFILASLITTVASAILTGDALTTAENLFRTLKKVSSFLIVAAMAAIGLNTDVVHLVKTGGPTIATGAACWVSIILVSLAMQVLMGSW